MSNTLNINPKKGYISAYLALILALIALFVSLFSLLNQSVYMDLVEIGKYPESLLPGTLSQDLIAVPASVFLIIFAIQFIRKNTVKAFIIMNGFTSFFLYGYGLFVISGNITSFYPVYMLIFGLSIYSLIYGLTSLNPGNEKLQLDAVLRRTMAVFFIIIFIVFVALWSIFLVQAIPSYTAPDTYAVIIMDLCIIMPALAITAFLLLQNDTYGIFLSGSILILIITLILSVVIGESLAPFYDNPANVLMITIYSAVVTFSLILAIYFFSKLKIVKAENINT